MANTKYPQVTVRLDEEVYDRIEREAEERDRSRAYIAREYMHDGMERKTDREEVPA